MHVSVNKFCTVGENVVHCGLYPVTFMAGLVTASVPIQLMDDEVSECDETFTAHIVIGEEGSSSSDGFILGSMSSVEVTVKDNEGNHEKHCNNFSSFWCI